MMEQVRVESALWIFFDVQDQILLVNAKGLNKAIITLKSLQIESTNSSSSSSILTSSISHRRGANSCSTSVSSPKILIFKAEISPSQSESIRVKMHRKAFFLIYWQIFPEACYFQKRLRIDRFSRTINANTLYWKV